MSRRVYCPSCLTEVPTSAGKVRSRCPGCGAKIDPSAADPKPAEPPKRRKVRRKPRKEYHFDWMGPVLSAGSAGLLLVVSLCCAGVVYLLTGGWNSSAWASGGGSHSTQPTEPTPPATTPATLPTPPGGATKPADKTALPKWLVKIDPPPAPVKPIEFRAEQGIPLSGNPLLASRGGPFLVETSERGLNMDADLIKKEPAKVPVIDLRVGKAIGGFPKAAIRSRQAVLRDDGRMLATRAQLLRIGSPLVEVWTIDSDQPLQIKVTETVLWMGF